MCVIASSAKRPACLHAAGLKTTDVLLDLFCGTGTIGLSLARSCQHVYGIEIMPSSVADAQRNASHNGINNATFVRADLDKMTGVVGNQIPQPDVIVTGKLLVLFQDVWI